MECRVPLPNCKVGGGGGQAPSLAQILSPFKPHGPGGDGSVVSLIC